MTQSDTEALKALVAAVKAPLPDDLKHAKSLIGRVTEGDTKLSLEELCETLHVMWRMHNEQAKILRCVSACLPALERMLASQGADVIRQVPQEAFDNLLRRRDELKASPADSMIHKGLSVIDTFIAECVALDDEPSAPPLAEPDVEAAAKEIYETMNMAVEWKGPTRERIKTDIAAIIRKHLRPTQQTEGASAAPQAEKK